MCVCAWGTFGRALFNAGNECNNERFIVYIRARLQTPPGVIIVTILTKRDGNDQKDYQINVSQVHAD